MATPFSDIYDLCMTSIRDYKINDLFNVTDLTNFENLMFGFMKKAIPKFIHCKKQLDQIMDTTTNEFTEDLTLNEQVILSDLMIIRWLDTKILDVTQMQWKLNDTDFKHYAESQNLTAKMNARTILQEDVGQDMTNYELGNVSWLDWQQQNFYIY